MHKINFTFNWFYADDRDIGYFNSGDNPVRAPAPTPTSRPGAPASTTGRTSTRPSRPPTYTPFEEHPQVINQPYITSWNNKQAPGYRAADDHYGYGPVYRSQSLDERDRPADRAARAR